MDDPVAELLAGTALKEQVRRRELERRVADLEAALQPFAKFVFGPNWGGHTMMATSGKEDTNVLCGYDGKGEITGVDVNYSDFCRARRVLGIKEKP